MLIPLSLSAELEFSTGGEPWAEYEPAYTATEKQVALIPFWNDQEDIVIQFGEELYSAIIEMGFHPVLIDMDNLPADVPRGGFPPFMHPGPSVVGGAPLALTGDVFFNEFSDRWHLRLYLWRGVESRPVSDELVAVNIEAFAMVLPFVLDWIFTWREILPPDPPPPMAEYNFLYVGFRMGWAPQLFSPLWGSDNFRMYLGNFNYMAVSFNIRFLDFQFHNFRLLGFRYPTLWPNYFLGLQLEYIAMWDASHAALTMKLPALLRLTALNTDETRSFSLFGGAYLFLPFGESQRIQFGHVSENVLWGYTAGFSLGRSLGPGTLHKGLRWSGDMFSSARKTVTDDALHHHFNRQTFTLFVGYEMGFLGDIEERVRRTWGRVRDRIRPRREDTGDRQYTTTEVPHAWDTHEYTYAEQDEHYGQDLF